jgi:hypothetical protein
MSSRFSSFILIIAALFCVVDGAARALQKVPLARLLSGVPARHGSSWYRNSRTYSEIHAPFSSRSVDTAAAPLRQPPCAGNSSDATPRPAETMISSYFGSDVRGNKRSDATVGSVHGENHASSVLEESPGSAQDSGDLALPNASVWANSRPAETMITSYFGSDLVGNKRKHWPQRLGAPARRALETPSITRRDGTRSVNPHGEN